MKKLLILFAFTGFVFLANAQSLSPTVIASSGGFFSNANGSLSYTVGEMTMVQTFTSSNNILTQGFQQPNDNIVGLLDFVKDPTGTFVLYPNPVVDKLWFGFEFAQPGSVAVAAYNGIGQKVADIYTGEYQTGKTVKEYVINTLAAGPYYLSLSYTGKDGKQQLLSKPFQVIN